MKAALSLSGVNEYLEKLAKLSKDLDTAADAGLKAAGEILFAEIYPRVPVGETHNLQEHIVINGPFQRGGEHFIYVELDMRDREAMLYGVYQEFGTVHMAPHSYLRAGVAAGKSRAHRALLKELEKALA